MLEIKIYLSHFATPITKGQRLVYTSLDEILAGQAVPVVSPTRYVYGKVLIKNYGSVFIDAPCEIENFITYIQDAKAAIFSGSLHRIDNSYFKLDFHYRRKLFITCGIKTISVSKPEFISVFRQAAEKYYQCMLALRRDASYYQQLAQ
ncbi:MAG: hypothetical protein ACRYFX_17515 [Janthinobacterium lividum]